LLTGGTGYKSTNNQLQADKYASEGYLVVMPDQFDNDPAPNTVDMAEVKQDTSWLESIKLKTAEGIKSFMIDMWLARHTPEKVLPLLHKVVEGAKEEFADAVSNGGGIYGVGYCFGAKYILILAGENSDPFATTKSKELPRRSQYSRLELLHMEQWSPWRTWKVSRHQCILQL
jgi:dienelactone hydrolase